MVVFFCVCVSTCCLKDGVKRLDVQGVSIKGGTTQGSGYLSV